MQRISLINAALSQFWAITEPALQEIFSLLQGTSDPLELAKAMHPQDYHKYVGAHGDLTTLQKQIDSDLPGSFRSDIRDNVAIIPIRGPIFPRANLMTMSGGTSISSLAVDFNTALTNDKVDTIIFNVDSPGGAVTGVGEFGEMILKARGSSGKKIISYVYGDGDSAALWILSQASEVILARSALVGSIGVVAGYTITDKADEKKGIQKIEIVSSQSPHKRVDIGTEEGRGRVQSMINGLADIFIAAVAEARGVDADYVVNNFGGGDLLLAEKAVEVGLADSIGTLEGIIDKHIHISSHSYYGGFTMLTVAQVKAEAPSVYDAIYQEGVAAAVQQNAAALSSAKEAGIVEGKSLGAKDENSRIKGIELILGVSASEAIIAKKFDMSVTKESIAVAMVEESNARTAALGSGRAASGLLLASNLRGTSATPPSGDAGDEAEALALETALNKGIHSHK